MIISVTAAAEALCAGEIIMLPTDTVYGLAVHPKHPEAIKEIFALKNRPATVPLQLLLPKRNNLAEALATELGAIVTDCARALIQPKFFPGPVSLILPLDPSRRPDWLAGRDELGVRCPNSQICQDILQQTGPIFATSANLHGEPTQGDFDAVCASLTPTHTLKAIHGGTLSQTASTIVNLVGPKPEVVRIGNISKADIFAALNRFVEPKAMPSGGQKP